MKKNLMMVVVLVCLVLAVSVAGVNANNPKQQAELEAAIKAAGSVQKIGPAEITLLDQAKIKLPAHHIYVPQPQAGKLLAAWGNVEDTKLVGLILPENDDDDWFVVIDYKKEGYSVKTSSKHSPPTKGQTTPLV